MKSITITIFSPEPPRMFKSEINEIGDTSKYFNKEFDDVPLPVKSPDFPNIPAWLEIKSRHQMNL